MILLPLEGLQRLGCACGGFRGGPAHLLVIGKSSIDYTFERIIGGHNFLQGSREGSLGRLATDILLVSAGICLSLSCMLS